MKSSFRTLAVALMVLPAAAFAQTQTPNESPTHAQVMNQLTQLRQDGYTPSKIHYPADIQAAQARVAAQGSTTTTSTSGFGGTTDGAMHAGSAMQANGTHWRSMFAHH